MSLDIRHHRIQQSGILVLLALPGLLQVKQRGCSWLVVSLAAVYVAILAETRLNCMGERESRKHGLEDAR